ncbi:hypothetical protein DSLASN_25080 [Desulfoluna limicola]|uniref:Peptidase C11 clostripain n=2 Tax=Desulfoluna limicola TaxID=2810562 RepID=A0ABM7PH14_9BACT|nr:hypothetical protein DSLASN_25080 [Desulfoluna limicola]
MVYLDGDNNLEEAALADFNEMEAAMGSLNMTVIVLFDRSSTNSRAQGDWGETRLYEVKHDTDLSAIASKRLSDTTWLGISGNETDELNMGSGESLKNFVTFCNETYPADHTALILWDHGSGWAPATVDIPTPDTKFIAIDDGSAGDALSMKEVAAALEGKGVDLLGFDACLMAETEVAWELRESARYMVASEGLEPSSGWDYTGFLDRFNGLNGGKKTPVELARCIADTYMDGGASGSELTLSVVDLAALSPLGKAVDELAMEVMAMGPDAVTTARYASTCYNEYTCVDLRQFAATLGASSATRDALDAALSNAVIYKVATSPENACGLSIYFPVFGYSSGQFSDYTPANLMFTQETLWDEALADYREGAFYYTFETVAGTPGLDTQLDVYADSLAFIAGNDDSAAPSGFSGLRIPVARGASYRLRVSSPGGFWHAGTPGSYGVYAGIGRATPCTPIEEANDAYEADDEPAFSSILDVETVQPHYLTSGDEDWVHVTVPE